MRYSINSALEDIQKFADEISLNGKTQLEQHAQQLGLNTQQTSQALIGIDYNTSAKQLPEK